MGYTALLFCPEEKTARTVTQVLSELEFTVEACSEPFAAVKKLMKQHFDAVVVDCDNEQNATLLFKSARNSASNQTSLAVAVVEGQAGVAKAFRIGANLVLTKPINIEQAKGTLRVARGLLRKGEPGKVGAPAAPGTAATSSAPVVAKPVSEAAPADRAARVFAAQPDEIPEVKPTPAWTGASASSTTATADDDLLEIDTGKPEIKPATPGTSKDGPILPTEIFAARSEAKPIFAGSPAITTGSGAASAPAPAREEKKVSQKPAASDADDDVLESGAGTAAPTSVVGSAPTFTLGGGYEGADGQSSGTGKKIIIGIAAAAIVATGLYFGWSHFQRPADQPATPETLVSTPAPSPNRLSAPPPAKPSAAPVTAEHASEPSASKERSRTDGSTEEDSKPATGTSKNSSKSESTPDEESPEPAPLMVKGGKAPGKHSKAAVAEAPAPSEIGLGTAQAVPPPNFTSTEPTFKPTLQTLNVSQGVSQGLLIKKVPPSYPPTALRMRIEGKVELVATISATGEISHVKVLSGDSQLTKAATDAVKKWKYKPYLLNGEPVEIQTQITVVFKLPQ